MRLEIKAEGRRHSTRLTFRDKQEMAEWLERNFPLLSTVPTFGHPVTLTEPSGRTYHFKVIEL